MPLKVLSLYTSILFVTNILKLTYCQRRIVNGIVSKGQPKYLAYFIKSPKSDRDFLGWICGGAIVHPLYILTSAACLEEVKYVYAITGYNKYVKSEDIDKDECTKRIKKKVVSRAFQKDKNEHNAKYQWNLRDISLAKVESPIDFRNPSYLEYCSWAPTMIRVNYYSNFEMPGTQVVTFGWGHKKFYGQVDDLVDHNEKYVHYTATLVIDNEFCKHLLDGHDDVRARVNIYRLCTLGLGNLDDSGKLNLRSNMNSSQVCYKSTNGNNETIPGKALNTTNSISTSIFNTTNSLNISSFLRIEHRTNGPCQNDHGGPLVTWIGGREYVIGVAYGNQVNKQMQCVGPYLYTSTFRNGEFIYCTLRFTRRSRYCEKQSKEKNYEIIVEEVDWTGNHVTRSIPTTSRASTTQTVTFRTNKITDHLNTRVTTLLVAKLTTETSTRLTTRLTTKTPTKLTTKTTTAEENREHQNSVTEEMSVIVETS